MILTFNEEKNIEKCLKSLFWVDEIIVIDSFSTDATLDICNQYSTKVFQRKFTGYASQRNFGLEKVSGQWVLMIDADEEVTEELSKEIKKIILRDNDIDAYYIPRNNFSFGKHIRYGSKYPDYLLRLFKRGKMRYDKEIHEIPIINGKVGYLNSCINHRNYSSISEYLPKFNFYTDIEAKEMIKNKIKISWGKIIFYPLLRFFWSYVIKSGWRDGFAGFLMSVYGSFYMLTKYLKYKEFLRKEKNADRN